jgi:hypothetical protein
LGLGELVPVVAEVAGVAVGVQDGVWFRVAAEQGGQQEVADRAASGEAMGGGRVLEEKEAEGAVREYKVELKKRQWAAEVAEVRRAVGRGQKWAGRVEVLKKEVEVLRKELRQEKKSRGSRERERGGESDRESRQGEQIGRADGEGREREQTGNRNRKQGSGSRLRERAGQKGAVGGVGGESKGGIGRGREEAVRERLRLIGALRRMAQGVV